MRLLLQHSFFIVPFCFFGFFGFFFYNVNETKNSVTV